MSSILRSAQNKLYSTMPSNKQQAFQSNFQQNKDWNWIQFWSISLGHILPEQFPTEQGLKQDLEDAIKKCYDHFQSNFQQNKDWNKIGVYHSREATTKSSRTISSRISVLADKNCPNKPPFKYTLSQFCWLLAKVPFFSQKKSIVIVHLSKYSYF